MKITALTCTCDRPEAFVLCEKYMARQTVKPDQWLVLDSDKVPTKCTAGQEYHYWPDLDGKGNMVAKVMRALKRGLIKGDILVFWENDDWYAADYIQWCVANLAQFALIGEGRNLYYNVQYRWWFEHGNLSHASLCATAMRRSLLPLLGAVCQNLQDPFIDSKLWTACHEAKRVVSPYGKRRSVGIKALPGTKGYGSGHDKTSGWAIQDPEMKKLRELIGNEDASAYEKFYEVPFVSKIEQRATMPKVEVHIATFNEEVIIPYALRHYKTFASRIVVHDGGSTDKTVQICKEAGVEVEFWNTNGEINDVLLRELKEQCWLGTTADWVIVVDADELIYFPQGAETTLRRYGNQQVPVVRTLGWEMVSDKLPTTMGQIYEEIKQGGEDNRWYGKPVLFSPKRVKSIHYSAGAHECQFKLKNGMQFGNPARVMVPPTFLLHYHHIDSVEKIGEKYDEHQKRFSEVNRKNGWGNFKPGRIHAQEKRDAIIAKLKQVIP